MIRCRASAALFIALSLLVAILPAKAVELPEICKIDPIPADLTTSLADLRTQVEKAMDTDPTQAVKLMCATIPRVAREKGEDSLEIAWWVGSLATPLIAYMDKTAEAMPLLAFARPILERRLGPNAPEIAEIYTAYAWIYFRQGLLAECNTAWENALRIREIVPGEKRIELQKALVGLAQARTALRDFAGARRYLDRAQAILVENNETVSDAAAAIQNVFTNVALREEDFANARVHAEEQLRIELALSHDAAQLVTAYSILGQVLERLDEFEESEKARREAVRLSESGEGGLQRHQLAALTNLGRLLNERGRPREALEFDKRALTLAEATLGPEAPRMVGVLQNLADAHRALGELATALHLYERASAIATQHASDVERGSLVAHQRGYGSLQLSLGEIADAKQSLEAALQTAGQDPKLSTERALVLLALAAVSARTGDQQQRALLEEALTLFSARLPATHPTILRVINELCGLEAEHTPSNAPHCDDVSARVESSRELEPALRHDVYAHLSRLAENRGDRAEARERAIQALAAATTLGTPDPLWRAQFHLALLLHHADERALAVLFGKQSISQIERLRGYFVNEDRRLDRQFLADKIDVYRAVADWLMEAGRIDEGLEVLRLLKSEELYDFVLRDAAFGSDEGKALLSADEQALWNQYVGALQSDDTTGAEIDRLSRLAEQGRISVTERVRLQQLLAQKSGDEAARVDRIRKFLQSGPGASKQTSDAAASQAPSALPTQRLQQEIKRLGPDTALAYFLMTDNGLRVLVATQSSQAVIQVPISITELKRDIGRFLDGLSKREEMLSASQSLYATIARPVDEVAQRAGVKRLVLWLDGALRYVPFAALHDGERYLVDKYAMTLQAAGDIEAPSTSLDKREPSVCGLGVTQAVAGYNALPAVADELCSIVRGPIAGLEATSKACPVPRTGTGALRGQGFADAAFTERRVHSLLDEPHEFSVLHLGTHFSLRPGNASRSYLLLGDGAKLTLDSIGALDFSGIELLTLSACQTGLGGAVGDDGREVEGLSAVVQRRGARQVVASLWQVEDASTARLMRTMYDALASRRSDAPRALQRAQLALRAVNQGGHHPYEHPYYWAGFVISGTAP